VTIGSPRPCGPTATHLPQTEVRGDRDALVVHGMEGGGDHEDEHDQVMGLVPGGTTRTMLPSIADQPSGLHTLEMGPVTFVCLSEVSSPAATTGTHSNRL
jgi:hypothetical protein